MKVINNFKKVKGQVRFKAIGIILWSALMMLLGSLYRTNTSVERDNMIIAPVHAVSIEAIDKKMIRLDRDQLAGKNLGEFAPYEPETSDLIARGHETYYSKDGEFGVGIWESKPGKETFTHLDYDELMYVLEGSFIVIDADGKSETFTAGQGVVLPKGWAGTFIVPKGGVRKIWSAYMGGKKG